MLLALSSNTNRRPRKKQKRTMKTQHRRVYQREVHAVIVLLDSAGANVLTPHCCLHSCSPLPRSGAHEPEHSFCFSFGLNLICPSNSDIIFCYLFRAKRSKMTSKHTKGHHDMWTSVDTVLKLAKPGGSVHRERANFRGLSCIEGDFCNQMFVENLSLRST